MYTTAYPWPENNLGLALKIDTVEISGSEFFGKRQKDFKEFTLQEIVILQQECHRASQELRLRNREMINSRLAKEITSDTFETYLKEAAERHAVLHDQHQRFGAEIYHRSHVRPAK